MTDIILHHYADSPFSEKVRVAFGIKQARLEVGARSPTIMPKPDLMPLTGGYRKTPVMQVGADIYCDTQLIMLEIEKRAPAPPLLPKGQEGEARALAMWVDRNIFWSAVGVVMGADRRQAARGLQEGPQRILRPPVRRRAGSRRAALPLARDQTYAQLSLAEDDAGRRPALSCWAPRPAWPTARSTIRCGSSRSGWVRARRAAARPAAADRRLVGAHEGASATASPPT